MIDFTLRSAYSIKENYIPRSEDIDDICDGCVNIPEMNINISYGHRNATPPLWYENIFLEKRISDKEYKTEQPIFVSGRDYFFLKGDTLNIYIPLEEVVDVKDYTTQERDIKGTYRIKIDFKYECVATGKDDRGIAIYNCKDALAYSDDFEIID